MLSDFEKLANHVKTAADSLFDGEESALSLIRRARSGLDGATAIDSGLAGLQKRLEDVFYEAQDIAGEFRSYRDNLSYDPRRQEQVDERLALLYNLNRKYGAGKGGKETAFSKEAQSPQLPEEAILAYRASAEAEIETLSGAEENRGKLKDEIAALEKTVVERAAVIRKKRIAGGTSLGGQITDILKRLGMPNAVFSPSVTAKTREDGTQAFLCGPWGAEEVQFLISANSGEPLKDLSRVASGGELSRVMLAIKTVLSAGDSADNIETLIFDEIDAGIGGEVALAVGLYLEKIGKKRQIFCVTHLASIAVRAGNHFKVEKRTEGGRTFTGVGPLSVHDRRKEIARMLAGDSGEAALAHADDLILKYGGNGNYGQKK
jgi:DNA repair protein RecN (Recombination protein N)